jgi:hypothetical protein
MSSSHVPYVAVLLIPAAGVFISGVVRLTMVESKKDRPGIWNIFAVGPDLMVAAVVAVPALLAGRNVGLAETSDKATATSGSWSINGLIVFIIFCLALICLSCERIWSKPAREGNGWKGPLLLGVIPPAICGVMALAAALVLGTP